MNFFKKIILLITLLGHSLYPILKNANAILLIPLPNLAMPASFQKIIDAYEKSSDTEKRLHWPLKINRLEVSSG
jgi:hypothetical protein